MIPSRKQIKIALLELLARSGPMPSIEVYGQLSEQFDLSQKDLELTTNGNESLFNKEVRWAKKDLVDDGRIKRPTQSGHGVWELIEPTNPPEERGPLLCKTREELEKTVRDLPSNTAIPIGQRNPDRNTTTVDTFVRDARVVRYVLDAADGNCEMCGNPSPFFKDNGDPFLEVHHVKRLSDGGSDTARNAIAVCPNCHREFHYGANRDALRVLIYSKVGRLMKE
ncbi:MULTISPECIES: HNH endonuclease signature motif containing protein [unclassified Thioalkalivibrio]|uniref:HNH endonuclease n=1 Tax=unclassified Thioalkalivibrio TaxID=2621013 RepID=UPI0012DCBE4A|nr:MULTISPECIES: HNH endonuclease signature motif containing protein [unclassified Thioalkalivibrio]